MLLTSRNGIILSMLALPVLISTAALADDLQRAMELCDTDPSCSYGAVDAEGGVVFKIKHEGAPVRLYCAADGECAKLYPRGLKVAIRGPTSVMSLARVLAAK